MKKKAVILVIVLFCLLVVGMLIYTRLKTSELNAAAFSAIFGA